MRVTLAACIFGTVTGIPAAHAQAGEGEAHGAIAWGLAAFVGVLIITGFLIVHAGRARGSSSDETGLQGNRMKKRRTKRE